MVMNEEARIQQIVEALEAGVDLGSRDLRWRGDRERFPVVKLPLDAVVLNPHSHRIKADLESHPMHDAVEADPFSDDSQEILGDLLRSIPGFEDLLSDLQEHGQEEPGIVTHKGLLVNANRRAVALRAGDATHISVMVLPSDATSAEIDDLELDLQIRRDLKVDYSFTAELLFIRDLANRRTNEQIARALRRTEDEVVQQQRMLALVREVQGVNPKLTLKFFDDKEQALKEIDERYQKLLTTSPDEAEKLKASRLLGLVAGAGYRELREIGPEFVEQFFVPALEELADEHQEAAGFLELAANRSGATGLPEGVDELLGSIDDENPAESGASAVDLYTTLASVRADETVALPGPNGEESDVAVGALVDIVRTAVEDGAQEAKGNRLAENKVQRPLKYLKEVNKKLRSVSKDLETVRHYEEFDRDGFDAQLETAARHLDAVRVLLEQETSASDD